MLTRFWNDRSGATSIEYCMIAAVISIIIIASATQIGVRLNAKFFGPVNGGLN